MFSRRRWNSQPRWMRRELPTADCNCWMRSATRAGRWGNSRLACGVATMSVVPVWAARRSMARESSRVAAPSSRTQRTWVWMSTIGASWDFGIGLGRVGQADDAIVGRRQVDRRQKAIVCPTVFGNGSRFVWYGGGTRDEHVIEGALIVEMQAGLVTVHEAEGGFIGKAGEGFGHAIQRVAGWLGFGFVFEEAGFDGPGAAQTPVGSDQLLDHA